MNLDNSMLISTYLVYLALSCLLTVWVAGTLHKNGRIFLVEAFGNEALADSVNHLLVVGFYLINLGYVSLALKVGTRPSDLAAGIEVLSYKIGCVSLILGAMHFFNLYVFSRIRRGSQLPKARPPVLPSQMLKNA